MAYSFNWRQIIIRMLMLWMSARYIACWACPNLFRMWNCPTLHGNSVELTTEKERKTHRHRHTHRHFEYASSKIDNKQNIIQNGLINFIVVNGNPFSWPICYFSFFFGYVTGVSRPMILDTLDIILEERNVKCLSEFMHDLFMAVRSKWV